MLCEVYNTAIRIKGKRIPIGTRMEFDDKLVKEHPDILIPIDKSDTESEIKIRIIELQEENNRLNQENIKTVYAVKERDKTIAKLKIMISELKEKIDLLMQQSKKRKVKKTN